MLNTKNAIWEVEQAEKSLIDIGALIERLSASKSKSKDQIHSVAGCLSADKNAVISRVLIDSDLMIAMLNQQNERITVENAFNVKFLADVELMYNERTPKKSKIQTLIKTTTTKSK